MEPLRTLALAGMRRDKGTFFGLTMLLFLAAFALTITTNLYFGLADREDVLLNQSGAGDVLAIDLAQNLNDNAIAEIEALPDVGEVKVTKAFAAPTSFEDEQGQELREQTPPSSNAYEAWGSSLNVNVFSDDLESYRDTQQGPSDGEIYVRPAQKLLYNVEIGDYVVLDICGKKTRLRVAGFFEDPQFGSPFMETNRGIVSAYTFEKLLSEIESANTSNTSTASNILFAGNAAYPITEINVFLAPSARDKGFNGQDLAREIGEQTTWGASANTLFSRQTLLGYNLMAVQVISAILGVFSLLLFAIALILCLHTASSSIESGYADWGILKGSGLSKKLLRRSLLTQFALCAIVGLLLGFVAGCLVVPLCWPPFLLLTGFLVVAPPFPWTAIVCCSMLLLALMSCIALKALKIGHISPLAALKQGAGDVRFSPRGASTISGNHLKISLAWRAIVSDKGRYVGLGACSLLLCSFIALCFGIGGSVAGDSAVYRAFGVWKSDMSVRIASDEISLDEVRSAIEEIAPIEREWAEGAIMLNLNGEARTFVGLSDRGVIDDAAIISGRAPKHTNEALIGLTMARSMGLSVGDEFVVNDHAGNAHAFMVSGLLSSVLNGGNGVVITYDGLKGLMGSEFETIDMSRQYQLSDSSKSGEVIMALSDQFGSDVDTELTGLFGSTTNMILFIRDLLMVVGYTMSGFALILACVAVILVSKRMLVSERRDLGIFRAMGFSVRSFRSSFAMRFLAISATGALLGSLMVMALGGKLVGALFSLFGVGAFGITLPLWEAIAISLSFSFIFALTAYAFSRGIKSVSVHELVTE